MLFDFHILSGTLVVYELCSWQINQ